MEKKYLVLVIMIIMVLSVVFSIIIFKDDIKGFKIIQEELDLPKEKCKLGENQCDGNTLLKCTPRGYMVANFCEEKGKICSDLEGGAQCVGHNKTEICEIVSNEKKIVHDVVGDSASPETDIINASMQQVLNNIIFEMTLIGDINPNDECYKFLIDSDYNKNTGDDIGTLGVDYYISFCWNFLDIISSNHSNFRGYITNYEVEGNKLRVIVNYTFLPVGSIMGWNAQRFSENGGDLLNTNGNYTLIPSDYRFEIDSINKIVDNPPTIMVPYDSSSKLELNLLRGEQLFSVNINQIEFNLSHPSHKVDDPYSIIFVDQNGNAIYNNEGFVLAKAELNECHLISDDVILAGGYQYGELDDPVIAVLPSQYIPPSSSKSIGQILEDYPNFMKMINQAYGIMSELYRGYVPFNGNHQILALLEDPDHCGGNNNPLEINACCYFDCGEGSPNYNLIIHEMGHNFGSSNHGAQGMQKFLWNNNGRAGILGECIASLPVIYIATDFYNYPEKYNFSNNDYEWTYYYQFLNMDTPYAESQLNSFEAMINNGEINGFFDEDGQFNRIAASCSWFQSYSYGFTSDYNPYGNEMIKRFLNLFSDQEPIGFSDDTETYFVAAFSAAAGDDLRNKMSYWGFTINNTYFDEIYPIISQELEN